MSAAVVLLAPLLLLLPAALVVLVVLAATARPDDVIGAGAAAARRHAVTGGVLAVVVAAVAVVALGASAATLDGLPQGQVVATLLLAGAAVHTVVLALTEVTWPRPTGVRRSGLLVRRRLVDVLPRPALVVTLGLAALVVVTAVAGVLAADRSGRALTRTGTGTDGATTWSTSPFPGAFYAVPVLLALAVLAVLVALALVLVLRRPAVTGADPATDAALRRASAHRVLRGAAAGCALTLAGLLAVSGTATRGVADGSTGLEVLAVALAIAAGVAALTGLVLLAVPAPRVPAPAAGPVVVPA